MKILLFGTGDYYNRYKKWFAQQDVIALLDNSEQKHHTFVLSSSGYFIFMTFIGCLEKTGKEGLSGIF